MIPVIVTTAIFHCCKVAESGKDQDTGREEPHRAPARSRAWTPRHRTETAATCPGALCRLLPATLDRLCLTDVYFCRLAIIIPFYFLITIQVNLDFHTKELIAKSMTQPTLLDPLGHGPVSAPPCSLSPWPFHSLTKPSLLLLQGLEPTSFLGLEYCSPRSPRSSPSSFLSFRYQLKSQLCGQTFF